MKRKWIFLLAPPAIALFIFIGGEVVMHLWNWLLPALFGWRTVTFWQAIGLLVLCRILFGRMGGHGPDRHKWRRPSAERWERMTPEEREKFRQGLRSRCAGFAGPEGETKAPAS
ncbi:MAG TPA: hypothetical protein VGZ91_01190 [Candidatus Sulfotelmatobacter sp.]|jgi:hypothetical protein|nr:hypothetical protein [Candidatus Sulfotelmatobacter sp.]